LRHIQIGFLNEDSVSILAKLLGIPSEPVWRFTILRSLHSSIIPKQFISGYPGIFKEFQGKQFHLLWQGGCDGFLAKDFHDRCDGHPNTLTLIWDTDGNIFGGFTPVKWESGSGSSKADNSLKSFIFTLKNPRNHPARRFVLHRAKRHQAIICDSKQGPHFYDFGISDRCNLPDTNSFTSRFGSSYVNDTGLDGRTFFTKSEYFRVKEIDVFEIRD
jgi:hypothetical protein